MSKFISKGVIALACLILSAEGASATCPVFHTLTNGTTADANQVMDNFNYILNCPGFVGKVGIGTSTPAVNLHVVGSGGNVQAIVEHSPSGGLLRFLEDGTAHIDSFSGSNGATLWINGASAGAILLGAAGGSVGIGLSTQPTATLDVAGTIHSSGAINGSDVRLKQDIQPLDVNATTIVAKLRPVTFTWRDPKDSGMKGIQTGLIAQDVEKVLPSSVTTADDAMKTKGIKYNELTVVLIKAVQQQQKEISALRVRVAKLERTHLAQARRERVAQAH